MASRREQVIEAVKALVAQALPFATVARNVDKPTRLEPGGMVIVRDGDAGEPQIDLSPPTWNYSHRIALEVMAWDAEDLAAALDSLMQPIGAAVKADRSLGGLCDFLQVEAPETDDFGADGVEPGRWADLIIVADYATTDPLN